MLEFLTVSLIVGGAAAWPAWSIGNKLGRRVPSWAAWALFSIWIWPTTMLVVWHFLFSSPIGRQGLAFLLKIGAGSRVTPDVIAKKIKAMFGPLSSVHPDPVTWHLIYALLGFAAGAVVPLVVFHFGLLKGQKQRQPQSPQPSLPLTFRPVALLNRAEASMFLALKEISNRHGLWVFSKTRLADLVEPVAPTGGWQHGWNIIAQKHADFVLVEPSLYMPVLAIELDGKHHEKPTQKHRDDQKDAALRSAGIPVLRVPPGAEADRNAFATLISSRISASSPTTSPSPDNPLAEVSIEVIMPDSAESIGDYLRHMVEGHPQDEETPQLPAYKLEAELVPSSCWYSNLRNMLPSGAWDRIRKDAYAAAGYKCEICGARGRLECHERWEYDDENHIQRLKGFIALCRKCHAVKHIGLAGIRASRGEEDYEALIRHFMSVNGASREAFDRHVESAFRIWEERSRHNWTTDLGHWANLVPRPDNQAGRGSQGD